MPIEHHPSGVTIVRLGNDPQFTADLGELTRQGLVKPARVVLDFATVRYINSSNLAKLLRLRKQLIEEDGKLVLCATSPQVQTIFTVTGLDRVFTLAATCDAALKLV